MENVSYVLGLGKFTVGLIQVGRYLVDLALLRPEVTLGITQIAPQQNAEHSQQKHYSCWRKGEPARAHASHYIRFLCTAFHAWFGGNGFKQLLAHTVWWLGAYGRHGQQRCVGAQGFQLAAALAACAQMSFKLGPLLRIIECAHGIERQRFSELWMPVHANAFLKASNPVRMRVLTVPRGSPVLPAISVCVMPSKNAISSVLRCSWGSCASAPRTLSTANFCAASPSRSIP